jgi:hypothetical protein
VLDEAFRVLKPGGRFAVSDIVVRGELPPDIRRSMEMWSGCVAGALEEGEFLSLLQEVGFENADIEPTRVYDAGDAMALLEGTGIDPEIGRSAEGRFMSAFVRASKPGGGGSRAAHHALPLKEKEPGTSSRACGCADDCCS